MCIWRESEAFSLAFCFALVAFVDHCPSLMAAPRVDRLSVPCLSTKATHWRCASRSFNPRDVMGNCRTKMRAKYVTTTERKGGRRARVEDGSNCDVAKTEQSAARRKEGRNATALCGRALGVRRVTRAHASFQWRLARPRTARALCELT